MRIEWVEQCQSCYGTGLYSGFGERDGAAVQCHTCDGTGRVERSHQYEEFMGRRRVSNIRSVYAASPGIVLAPDVVPGGALYVEWFENPAIVLERGRETREHTCPAWWCQSVSSASMPNRWDECEGIGGRFSDCRHFGDKAACWARYDREKIEAATSAKERNPDPGDETA